MQTKIYKEKNWKLGKWKPRTDCFVTQDKKIPPTRCSGIEIHYGYWASSARRYFYGVQEAIYRDVLINKDERHHPVLPVAWLPTVGKKLWSIILINTSKAHVTVGTCRMKNEHHTPYSGGWRSSSDDNKCWRIFSNQLFLILKIAIFTSYELKTSLLLQSQSRDL